MRWLSCVLVSASLCRGVLGAALPSAGERAAVVLPDFGAELRAFEAPEKRPVKWWPHVVNAGWGGGRGGPERNGGWLDENWELVDYLDRSGDYTTHEYLTHRGIWYEVYGYNEYQETIHFCETGARELLWDNGIARDMNDERTLSRHYNTKVKWWKEKVGWDAYIVCNNAPRWSAIINYDWLSSPLLGFAVSQDNIGGPTSRIGPGGHGRYCDQCNAKFFHYLTATNRLPEFRKQYAHIRDYVQAELTGVLRQLPPHVRSRWDAAEAALLAKLCAPPVMSEYQKFLYLSHLHNLMRHYQDAKLLAARLGRDYDVHGNQGGGFIGPNPYQVALADFVDTVWFESKGLSTYDIFKYGWNNAWGAFRFEMGWAMTRGRKPLMCMTGFHKRTPDIVEHEMAEECAGGGVLFVNQAGLEKQPELQQKLTEYFRFRHAHRGLFALQGKRRYAQIALAYSIPTMMYRNYQYSGDAPPVNALSGMARALEEGHLPFDVVILNHPEIHADRVTLDDLKRYRLVILPALECLTDAQIELLARYARGGGTLGVIGECGVRNEDNLPRERPLVEEWRESGKVADLLPGRRFLRCRLKEDEQTRGVTRIAIASARKALAGRALLSGDLPRMLWVKTWNHWDEYVSLHFVNYDIDFESGATTETKPVSLTVTVPAEVRPEAALWLTPDGGEQKLATTVEGRNVTVTLPPIRVYGVLVIGRRGLDAKRSAVLRGEALLARATMAADGDWGELAELASAVQEASTHCSDGTCTDREAAQYAEAASQLLRAVQRRQDEAYVGRVQEAAATDGAALSLDFGGRGAKVPWKSVRNDTEYTSARGFGWLPPDDGSAPMPEEAHYAMAQRYGSRFVNDLAEQRILFWPYRTQPPAPLLMSLSCGARRRFRVDVSPGSYTVRVVTTNPSWTNRNFQVSGMVSVNGTVRLLDAVHDRGAVVSREFSVAAPDGKLDFTFGGPTGWAVSALVIKPGVPAWVDPQMTHGVRTWHVSPRYSNPDWHPIVQTVCPPEQRLSQLPEPNWTEVRAPATGLPVVELGTNREAEVGDLVYAVAAHREPKARTAYLHFGASSQAQIWLNGESVGYVPNEKGVRRDEYVAPLQLREGENVLVVKLQRFWERRWLFYASITADR